MMRLSLCLAAACPPLLAAASCTAGSQQCEDSAEDVGLLQAKVFKHEHQQTATCQVGDFLACPDHIGNCAGEQCCPSSDGGPTYPCPSAPAGWGQGYCGTSVKKVDCLAPGPGPAPAPQPTTSSTTASPTPSPGYYPHFDTSADYLDIASRAKGVSGNAGNLSDNYYLVVGDQGGCDGGCSDCCAMQMQVAEKMKQYVADRKAKNPNSELLFVIAVGDNFYWTGASEGRFAGTWLNVYGETLTSVPWFAVFGNHDYGNADPGTGCPNVNPRFTCDSSNMNTAACGGPKPYSTMTQGYDSNAFNADKGGVDGASRANWHQPDYTYYYTIPKLDLEIIAMDYNFYDLDGLGGDGPYKSASKLTDHCGGYDELSDSLANIRDASTELLNSRSAAAQSKNVAISGHYPAFFQDNINLRNNFLAGLPDGTPEPKVFNFYGHTHIQKCEGQDSTGECVDFLTGGSGGCCGLGDVPAGFVSITFNSNVEQTVECFLTDECTINPYQVTLGMIPNANNTAEICQHTNDDPKCRDYVGPEPR